MIDPTVVCILGGGRGARLFPQTKCRSKPSVPVVGKYRQIDNPISNCINSGLDQVYVLTQFNSVSLHQHLRRDYPYELIRRGLVEVLAAQQTMDAGSDWYEGTADAVRKNLRNLAQPGVRMDYRRMIEPHRRSGVSGTLASVRVATKRTSDPGVLKLRTRIGRNVTICNSVLLGADYFQTDDDIASDRETGARD